jgi:DNA adenine methylase
MGDAVRYLGGKTRIAKQIAAEVDRVRRPGQLVWDAFCGGLSVSRALLKNGPVLSTDACAPLIALYRAVQNGWQPPTEVSEETWRAARALPDSDPMKAFCGFGCSFGGRYFQGFARGAGRNWADECRRGLLRDVPGLCFGRLDFLQQTPHSFDGVLYLDPPYEGTKTYAGLPAFNSQVLWDRAREWAEFCPVFVSEYQGPPEFSVCLSLAHKQTVAPAQSGDRADTIEKLFLKMPEKGRQPCRIAT